MGLLQDIAPAPRKVMTLFYLVDTSGSMDGEKIGKVNATMEECFPLLKEVAKANDDAEIKVAILQFSSGCSWITPESGPVGLDDIAWNNLTSGGLTDFGSALLELDKRLSRNEYLKSITGAYAPVILLLSDGEPTDDWESALKQIKQNNWFKNAIKIAFAINIESSASKSVLEGFTGNSEAILEVKDLDTLKKMIHKVSVRASEFQSHSKHVENENLTPEDDSASIVKEVLSELDENQNNNINDQNKSFKDPTDEWGDW